MTQVLLEILALSAIYSIVVLGLGFIAGMGGLFSVCQAAMFGLGAFVFSGFYSFGLPTDLLVTLPTAAVAGALVSALVALVALRVSGDFFVVASFGLQVVIIDALYNWDKVTGGPSGVYGLPTPQLGGLNIASQQQQTVLVVVAAALCFGFGWWLRRAPFGRLVRAMAADEVALQAAGFRPSRLKLTTIVIGGSFASLAGVLYASYIGIAQVTDFDINTSIILLAAVLLGGANSLWGSVIGAVLFSAIPRLLTLFSISASLTGPLLQLTFGIFLVLTMLFVPGGVTSGLVRARDWLRDRRQHSSPDAGAPASSARIESARS